MGTSFKKKKYKNAEKHEGKKRDGKNTQKKRKKEDEYKDNPNENY